MVHDVVIVGGGVLGTCCANWLRRFRPEVRFALVEADRIGHPASSSHGTERAIRAGYADRYYCDLAIEAIDVWKEWQEELEIEAYHETGVLWLASAPEGPEAEIYRYLSGRGYPIERVEAGEVAARFGAFRCPSGGVAYLERIGGFLDNQAIAGAIRDRLVRHEACRLHESRRIEALETAGSRVVAARAGDEAVEGRAFVLVPGPWLAALDGLEAKVTPTRQDLAFFEPDDPEPFTAGPDFPVFARDLFSASAAGCGYYGFGVHSANPRVKIGRHVAGIPFDPDLPRDRSDALTREFVEGCRSFLSETLPGLESAPLHHTHICCYSLTSSPDGHFCVGALPGASNAFVGGTGNGHMFKFGPLLGEALARLAIGEEPHIDLGPLSPEGFVRLV